MGPTFHLTLKPRPPHTRPFPVQHPRYIRATNTINNSIQVTASQVTILEAHLSCLVGVSHSNRSIYSLALLPAGLKSKVICAPSTSL